MKQERKNLIQSIERALNILETVRDSKKPVRAIDIARSVGLSATASNNIVRTLYIRGYLDQNEAGHYLLGAQSYLLGNAADAWSELRNLAKAPMLELSRKSGQLCFLGVEYLGEIICVNLVEGNGPLSVPKTQEWKDQFHCTAAGKILLSGMENDRFADFKKSYRLKKLTENTLTDWKSLEKDIEEIRLRKFSVCRDESVFGISSIGVPIYQKGKVKAALSIAFSSYFLNSQYQKKMIAELQAAAEKISQELDSK